jgi:biotin transport system substrate-specific component
MTTQTFRHQTVSQRLWPVPSDKTRALFRVFVLVASFNLLLVFSARASFFLPFDPVPVTMQTLVVLLAGILLGSRLGALTVAAYVAEGICGLPVFALNVSAGLFSPTFGYLVGFVVAAWLVGEFSSRGADRTSPKTIAMMVVGNLVMYFCGCAWLSHFVGGISKALVLGTLPFIPGDILKIAVASVLLPRLWKLIGAREN